jgi:hypothetical protein
MKQYHGSYSATEPPTNNNYKTRQIGLNEIIWKQYHASYSDTEPPTDTNLKPGLSYGKNVIATIKYHGIHIRAKDFDGGLSILTGKGPNKKLRNNTLATTEPQSHLPTPITMQGLSNGKNVIATIKYHWIHIQS